MPMLRLIYPSHARMIWVMAMAWKQLIEIIAESADSTACAVGEQQQTYQTSTFNQLQD
jgi:hypothetical protein